MTNRLKAQGGRAMFCELTDTIAEIFEISGFSEILDIHRTKDDDALKQTTR